MKQILLLFLFLAGSRCDTEEKYVVGPIMSDHPCSDSTDIAIGFEAGHQLKDINRYYMYVGMSFALDSKLAVQFDSLVNITLTLKVDEYIRTTLSGGKAYAFHFFRPQEGMGFLVKGAEPGVIPYLQSCTINNVEYCSQPRQGFLKKYATKNGYHKMQSCGRRAIDHSELIVNGSPTVPGEWPWHAAIYRLKKPSKQYICGGTLISNTFVLTAAHCVSFRGSKYQPEVFSVVLGKYKLFEEEQESVEKQVLQIIVHQRYDYRHLYNDIALMKLTTEVEYNDFIRAACLMRPDDKSKLSSDQMHGTMVGWGFDHTDNLSRTLMKATMPIVSEATCLKSHSFYYIYTMNGNSFCAGYLNGTSACNGDSGSALQVFVQDNTMPEKPNQLSGTWHVKGIVSNSIARDNEAICDPEQYVVFTDVENFVEWIDTYLEG